MKNDICRRCIRSVTVGIENSLKIEFNGNKYIFPLVIPEETVCSKSAGEIIIARRSNNCNTYLGVLPYIKKYIPKEIKR